MKKLIVTLFVWNFVLTGTVVYLAVDKHQKEEMLAMYINKKEQDDRQSFRWIYNQLSEVKPLPTLPD